MDTPGTTWTRARVETRLIAAFKLMPGLPVYGIGGRQLRTAEDRRSTPLTDALEWASLLDGDPDGRKYLWAWARCQATRDSFGALCRGHGWKRTTVEVGRRRAAAAIAARLSAAASFPRPSSALDTGKERPGRSPRVA